MKGISRIRWNLGREAFQELSRVQIRDPQKAHKHKHFIGISLPYWASL